MGVFFCLLLPEDFTGESATLRTAGLMKFGSADLELTRVPLDMTGDVSAFLLDASEYLIQGDLLEPDEVVGYRDTLFRTVATDLAGPGHAEVLRIVDAPEDEDEPLVATTGSEGAPRLVAAIRRARTDVEGFRARGGFTAN